MNLVETAIRIKILGLNFELYIASRFDNFDQIVLFHPCHPELNVDDKTQILCANKVTVKETLLVFLESHSNGVTLTFFENFDRYGKSGKLQYGFK